MTMKRCSKFLAWVLTLIMVFGMMPVAVLAEGEDNGNDGASATTTTTLSLTVPGDTLGISGKSGVLTVCVGGKYTAVINAKYNDYRREAKDVTVIDGAVFCRSGQEPSIWTIEKTPDAGDGYYYLKNGSEYLTLTKDKGVVMTSTPTAVLVSVENGKLKFKSPETDKWLTLRDNKASSGISCDTNKGETHFELLPLEISDKVIAEFNCNGAPGTVDPIEKNIGDVITLPNYEGDYIGKELVGWKSSSDNKTYNIGDVFTLPDKMSVTFTAVWQGRKTVTFDANGGDLEAPSAITIKKGVTSVTLPDYSGTKDDYKFLGWSTTADPYATVNKLPRDIYRPGEEYPVQDTISSKLYAQWSYLGENDVRFGIRLDAKIPKEPGDYETSSYSKLKVNTYQTVEEQRWVVDTTASGTISGNHLVNDVTRNLSYLPTDEELKAIYPTFDPETQYVHWYVMKWTERNGWVHVDGVILNRSQMTVSYDNNATEKVNVPLGYQVETGTTIVVGAKKGSTTATDPVRNGYNFVGWNTKADGQGPSYNTGDTITVDSSITLYAIWSKGAMKVTVKNTDEKGNSLEGASFELKKGATKLTALSSNGACDTLENETVYSLAETTAPTGHTKISEKFFFKVAVDTEGKLALRICDATGKAVEAPEWLTISDATVNNGITQITITVEDLLTKYKVAYDLEQTPTDIEVPTPELYEKDGTVTLADVADPDGYVFSGWMINGQKINGSSFKMPEADIVLKGIYYGPISIDIESDWQDGTVGYEGAIITLTAVLHDADDLDCTIQWQYLADGEWVNWKEPTLNRKTSYELTKETSGRIWRVIVTDAKPHQD
jgi:uncharacterized repeat protein (TIGR02543 family)